MNTNRLVVGLALALVLLVGLGSAEAGQKGQGKFVGTFENNQIDTDGDGNLGFSFPGTSKGTGGHGIFNGVGESDFSSSVPCQLPGEEPPGTGFGFGGLLSEYTLLFEGREDLFSYTYDRLGAPGGLNCVDFATGLAYFEGNAVITGGAGRYEGATGTFHSTCTTFTTYGPDTGGNYAGWGFCDFDFDID